jgi:hypothetical protein
VTASVSKLAVFHIRVESVQGKTSSSAPQMNASRVATPSVRRSRYSAQAVEAANSTATRRNSSLVWPSASYSSTSIPVSTGR